MEHAHFSLSPTFFSLSFPFHRARLSPSPRESTMSTAPFRAMSPNSTILRVWRLRRRSIRFDGCLSRTLHTSCFPPMVRASCIHTLEKTGSWCDWLIFSTFAVNHFKWLLFLKALSKSMFLRYCCFSTRPYLIKIVPVFLKKWVWPTLKLQTALMGRPPKTTICCVSLLFNLPLEVFHFPGSPVLL